ncbi:UDP-galactopyranose mutase [Trichormus variabilis ATCC 29413]|uniref:UDP-galactopyranose mutase n=2 Tax=Anabaena variabilis TaxID=264691 RepID=Q3MH74_TRIV2|nr:MULTISPECIES: FAD-dependent oxidoreductase [Nostocaceae]ABA19662.1 UDP-galactopyranose mutase [Trichormus variabilis ATCC 29413]MBC1215520.1 FAD-dependent oxidoreductase [Trichormus variabilis ARAD]MBC1256793.1 FAD-dependent oxidoreductase [Trichormus variabilis V5]MBC1265955.1 FAD-dependent oxidoreductase [Trichormus variabilis FSR]MBC1302229.1 FAD-dependent oxidoreductase [Trichormus variabilis N2B]
MSLLPNLPESTNNISRRTLLKVFGVGAVAGVTGYSRFTKPKPTVFQKDTLSLPRLLNQAKSVIVIGGGLAGLACAYELSQRGFTVTLIEKSPQLGGKIASWQIEAVGETFMMEHGFHGFFPQYYNLKSIVAELGINDNFQSLNFYSVVYRGDQYKPEVFRPSHSAFPWNIVDLAIASPNRFQWGINLTKIKHLQVFQAITGFQREKNYQRFDNISVADWVKTEFPQGLYDLYFLPFAKSSLNAPDTMSVGELMQFFHFYFFGNPEGLAFNGTKDDMGTSLVQPIANSVKNKNGTILTDATVSEIIAKDGKIRGLKYYVGSNQNNVPFWVKRNSVITEEKTEYFGAADEVFAVESASETAISLTCTHQGCTVKKSTDGKYRCPCHGAEFAADGKVLKGPAKRDLQKLQVVQKQNDELQLLATTNDALLPETITADYYVFATDVPGVQQLFKHISGDVDQTVRSQVENLSIADPFAVCRFWFDQDFEWEQSNFTSLSGYQLTDSITLYHRIQQQFIDWSQKTGGSVVELHAYCYKEKEFPTQEALLTTFENELYDIVPQLKQAKLLHRELVNQHNFSGYPPNSYGERPETSTNISNLLFAGDWVKMPFPCGLMERAVSSGLIAANEILHREGLQRRSLLSVNPEGLLQI